MSCPACPDPSGLLSTDLNPPTPLMKGVQQNLCCPYPSQSQPAAVMDNKGKVRIIIIQLEMEIMIWLQLKLEIKARSKRVLTSLIS